jgi:hypothetical protein
MSVPNASADRPSAAITPAPGTPDQPEWPLPPGVRCPLGLQAGRHSSVPC